MGISQFKLLCKNFFTTGTLADVTNLLPNTKVNLYFDGSLYLFRGCVRDALETNGTYNSKKVAEITNYKIQNMIKEIQANNIEINRIYIYFDGTRPGLKSYTSEKRISKSNDTNKKSVGKLKINKIDIQNYLTSVLTKYIQIEIKQLYIGEGEHETFIRRDRSLPSIILTDDSDIYHIAYGYEQETCNDLVFMCTTDLKVINLSKLKDAFKMPRYAFVLLMMLRGSDYTNSLFTLTMVNGVIKAFQGTSDPVINSYVENIKRIAATYSDEENVSRIHIKLNLPATPNELVDEIPITCHTYPHVYQEKDIYTTIRYFLLILLNQEIFYDVKWNLQSEKNTYDSTVVNIYNEISNLWWGTNYSTIGSLFSEYDNGYYTYTQNLSSFGFHTAIINRSYEEFNELYDQERNLKHKCDFTTSHAIFKSMKTKYAMAYKNV